MPSPYEGSPTRLVTPTSSTEVYNNLINPLLGPTAWGSALTLLSGGVYKLTYSFPWGSGGTATFDTNYGDGEDTATTRFGLNNGLSDLVAYVFTRLGFNEGAQDGGKPLVYLNDGNGKLRRFDIAKLPMHGTINKGGPELQATGGDFNGDGFWDLALFGSTAHRGGGDVELYYLPGHIDYLLGP